MVSNGRLQHHHFGTPLPCGFNSASSGRGSPFHSLALPTLMSLLAIFFGLLQAHRSATPVVLGSQRSVPEGRRSMRVSGRSCFSLAACAGGFLSGAQPTSGALFRPALARTPIRLASALAQPVVSVFTSPFSHQSTTEKTALSSTTWANPALNLAPFGRWALRDKAAQRRLALRENSTCRPFLTSPSES